MRVFSMMGLVWASAALASPKVLLFPAVGTTQQVTLAGRVLKHVGSEGSTTLSRNVKRLLANDWVGAEVDVSFGGQSQRVVSGHDGDFEVTFEAAKGAAFAVGATGASARVKGADTGSAVVHVLPDDAPFLVVSDFDDTLAVTHVVQTTQLVETVFLKDERSQPVVRGMPSLYRCLAQQPSAPGFALVSGSPVQFSARIGRFLSGHGFPGFGLYLRDLGPSTLRDYKQPVIRALLQRLPQKVVLVGDSGEHDPEVYAQLRQEHPDRVLAVYIRNAGHAEDTKRFENMVLFDEPLEAARDAVKRGLMTSGCFEAELLKERP